MIQGLFLVATFGGRILRFLWGLFISSGVLAAGFTFEPPPSPEWLLYLLYLPQTKSYGFRRHFHALKTLHVRCMGS